MRTIFYVVLVIAISPCVVAAQAPTSVKVIGERVNLRARPDMNSEVVGQVARDQVLTAKSFQDEWVEVLAPNSVDVWVHKDFVADNRVTADRLYVRGGPGINWQSVGQMNRNDPIFPRGEFGEWLKIAPPPDCSLWVNRKYVEVIQREKTPPPKPTMEPPPQVGEREVVKRADATPGPAPARTFRPSEREAALTPSGASAVTVIPPNEAPPPPADLKLIPLEGQGRPVQREGTIRLAGFVLGRPSRYRLVQDDGVRIQTICYVRGNNSQLASLLGRRVLIRGREYWVRGVKDPVLVPEEIVPFAHR